MIIRKIKPEELKRTNELFSIAFEFELNDSRTAMQVYEEISSAPASREDFYWQERWAAFEDDNKTMMSFFVAKPFPIHFDGHQCTMTGIGGVASLPQYRCRGGIRACFEAALADMYEHGMAFSYLYPFSTAYYRKFGYELCCERTVYDIKLSGIKQFSLEGSCYLIDYEHPMLEDIKQIHQVWQNRYNMMVINEDFEYAWVKKSNPAKDQVFTYVYKDKNGIPKGYMTFNKVDEASGRNLKCSRFVFSDKEGLQGLLNLAHSLGTDHAYFSFPVPVDQAIAPLLPEWSGFGTRSQVFAGMARVINAEQVLRMSRYRGTGSLVIRINDEQIKHNHNTFFVRFEQDTASEVHITDAQPNMTMGIHDFSRLIIGTCDLADIIYLQSVQIHTHSADIGKVFYRKPIYITESF